jgi:hypothetical protein
MRKKIILVAALVLAMATAAQADSTVSKSFNNKSKGSIHHNTYILSSKAPMLIHPKVTMDLKARRKALWSRPTCTMRSKEPVPSAA